MKPFTSMITSVAGMFEGVDVIAYYSFMANNSCILHLQELVAGQVVWRLACYILTRRVES